MRRALVFVGHWGGNLGFACVIAHSAEEAVGFACGAPATPQRASHSRAVICSPSSAHHGVRPVMYTS